MRNIFKLLTAFSLCCLNTGLNADAMEPVPQEKFSMIDNPNNVDLTKIGVSKGIPNKLSNKEFSMIDNPNNVDLTKIGIPSSNAIKTNNDKIDIPQKTSNDGEPAIKLDYPFNLLVVADSEDRMKKVTSLLCNNNLSLSLGDLKNLQDLNYYKSGGIYPAVNNPNINVLCITLDDFINDSFNYDWDFICQNTTKIFYTFGWDSDNAEKYFDTLKNSITNLINIGVAKI